MNEPRKPARRGGGKPQGGARPGRPDSGPGPRGYGGGSGGPGGRGAGRAIGAGRTTGGGRIAPARGARVVLPEDPARELVHSTLFRQAHKYPDLIVDALDDTGLNPLDGAFAHALYDAVVRRWITLTFLLNEAADRRFSEFDALVRSALLAGGAQLLFMDKVPAHAAVFQSVEYAKRSPKGGGGAGRVVNAVLRRLEPLITPLAEARRDTWTDKRDELPMSDGSARVIAPDVLPVDPLQRLSVATSHPIELLRSWMRSASMREVRALALHGLAAPPIILNGANAASPLPPEAVPHSVPGHYVFTGTHAALRELLAARADVWVQDPGSSLAVETVADLRPSTVIDACAGMGTKTRQLAAAFPGARIIATDIDRPRLRTLRDVCRALPNVTVIEYEKLQEHAGTADLLLLDVPCSNTGVLARRVEARYRYSEDRIEKLTGAQRQIIADTLPLLARGPSGSKTAGARILYSTCSLDPRENEEIVEWAAKWHDLRVARGHRRAPGGVPGGPPTDYTDGSFAALLE